MLVTKRSLDLHQMTAPDFLSRIRSRQVLLDSVMLTVEHEPPPLVTIKQPDNLVHGQPDSSYAEAHSDQFQSVFCPGHVTSCFARHFTYHVHRFLRPFQREQITPWKMPNNPLPKKQPINHLTTSMTPSGTSQFALSCTFGDFSLCKHSRQSSP